MKITLYQYSAKDKTIGDRPNPAIIEHKKLNWEYNLNTHLPYSTWHDVEYEIDEKYKRLFRNKEFNVKMTVREATGFGLTYYANLNCVKMLFFKRIYGIHWTQQPEWIKFYIGAMVGLISGVVGGYILWLFTHKCPC